jgi:hypothetical protein
MILNFHRPPVKHLFKMAEKTLSTIKERIYAKQQALRCRLASAFKSAKVREEARVRALFKYQGGRHFSFGRVLLHTRVGSSFPPVGEGAPYQCRVNFP